MVAAVIAADAISWQMVTSKWAYVPAVRKGMKV